jgi:dTDP-4-amino-4,6-dideoxygalactose transaminase
MSGEEQRYVAEAFDSNWISPLGPQVDAFEREFCGRVGIPHAVALNSGTAALHIALRLLGLGKKDDVIAPTLTFIGGVSPAVFQGATLTFIDSDRESWNMDPSLLQEVLSEKKKKGCMPKVVICADIYGQCADYDRIGRICEEYGIPLIMDSAEALGAIYKDRNAGNAGKAAIYSFNGNKIITTSGGGMLASDDKTLIEHARFLSQQARDPAPHYEHSQIGYNYRMSNILAAIGRGQLKVLDERVKQKKMIFERYQKALAEVPGVEFMPEAGYGTCTRWLTVILITPELYGYDREIVRLALEEQNIESRAVWKPMHLQPVFKGAPIRGGEVAEDLFNRGLCLPSGTAMSDTDIDRVIDVIIKVHNKGYEYNRIL